MYHWPPLGSPTCWTGTRDYGDVELGRWIDEHLIPGGNGVGFRAPAPGTGGSAVLTAVLLALAVAAIGFVVWMFVRQPRRARARERDPATEIELWTALRQREATVIGATSKRAALAQADRVVVLVEGRVAAVGAWSDLSRDWGHLAG